jgi:DnaJ-class molecular chaperone
VVEMKKCEKCGGTGIVGEAESTEGKIQIFCLECFGTGVKKNDEPEKKIRERSG